MIRNYAISVSLFVCLLSATVFASPEKELFETGVNHLKQQRYEAAIDVFTELIEQDPDNPDAYKNRGVAYMKLSQYDAAIQDFEKTKQMMPDLKGLHSNLGVAWYYKGQYEKAISHYDTEIRLSPDSHYAYFNRAICWAELRKYDKSMDDIDQTLALAPDFYLAHCLKGDMYLETGDIGAARAAYMEAVSVDPEADYAKNQLEKLGQVPEETKPPVAETTEPSPAAEPPAARTKEQPLNDTLADVPENKASEAEKKLPDEQSPVTGEQGMDEKVPGPGKQAPDEPARAHEYEIQTGAFQVRENALNQLNELLEKGYEARILTLTRAGNKTWYLVRIGSFPDRKSANQAMAAFVEKTGMKAYVRPWNRF